MRGGGRVVASHGGVVDLLERVFDRGVVLHADVLITLSGVPLIGINLRAALAGAETLRRYGLMRDWLERPAPAGTHHEEGSPR